MARGVGSGGAGGTVVLEGPEGIGKSTLLAVARELATDLRVLGARGGELEREFPFGIVRQLLEPPVAAAGGFEREGLLAGAAALAGPVLLAHDDAGVAEPGFSILHGLYWLTANLGGDRSSLLVVDDLQGADRASLRWLVFLGRRLVGLLVAKGRRRRARCCRCSMSRLRVSGGFTLSELSESGGGRVGGRAARRGARWGVRCGVS